MRIDISGLYQVISKLVDFLKSTSIVLGNHTVSFWGIVISLGTMESINFILNRKNYKNDDE